MVKHFFITQLHYPFTALIIHNAIAITAQENPFYHATGGCYRSHLRPKVRLVPCRTDMSLQRSKVHISSKCTIVGGICVKTG